MANLTRREILRIAARAGLSGVAGGRLRGSIAYRGAVLAKDPVAYWRLGESNGLTAFDETASAYDGTYKGNSTYGELGAIRDDPNTAIQCNGQDYVEIPDAEDLSQPASGLGLSVEVWMRPDALIFPGETSDPYVHWLGKGVPGQHEWALRFYSQNTKRPNRVSAYIWNPAGGLGAGAYFEDELVEREWIHVVACYEPGDLHTDPPPGVHIYKNGVHRLGPPSSGTLYRTYGILPAHGRAPVRLGTRDLGSFLLGGLDEVAIYPRVLTPEQVMENYTTGIS